MRENKISSLETTKLFKINKIFNKLISQEITSLDHSIKILQKIAKIKKVSKSQIPTNSKCLINSEKIIHNFRKMFNLNLFRKNS